MATRPRGGSYFTEFMVAGSRYRGTFDTYAEGERWELEVRHALKLGKPAPEPSKGGRVSGGKIGTYQQVADYALRNDWQDGSADYRENVSRIIKEQADWFGAATPMAAIGRQEVDGYVAYLRSTGNSNGTVNRKMSTLSKLFKTAKALDVCDRPPWPTRLKEKAFKIRFIYPREEKVMLDHALACQDQDLHDMMAFALDTGARFSEIVKAEWDWFAPNFASWIIWSRKADNPFGMPLTERLRSILMRRKRIKGNQNGPFTDQSYRSVRHRLEGLLERLEIKGVTFHTFRHTTASRLVQRGVDLRRVQIWMGHKTIQTTIRYANLAPNDLMDVVKVLEPAAPVVEPVKEAA